MEMVDYVKLAVRRWKDFRGRSRRAEYWWFFLATVIAMIVAGVLDGLLFGNMDSGPLQFLVFVACLVFGVGLSFRRLHDIDKSAWWLLIGLIPILGTLVLLYFHVKRGTPGPNRYGPDPLDAVAEASDPLVN